MSLVATEIPLFKISQEDIDNRIYIEPDSEKTDMSIPKYDKKRDKMQVIIVGQKSWVIVNCNHLIYHRKSVEKSYIRTLRFYDLVENKFVKSILLDCIPLKLNDDYAQYDNSYIQYRHLLFYFKTIHTDFEGKKDEPFMRENKKGSSHL